MRIVGGRLRGRRLAAPGGRQIRPTSDRLREALFNVLQHRYGLPTPETRVLDLFAGTGALALEALSRGAAAALMVDTDAAARGLIRENIEALGLGGRARVFRRDASRLGGAGTIEPFHLVFCDPPYGRRLGEAALQAALAGGWLAPGALVVLEETAGAVITLLDGFERLEVRAAGGSQLLFARLAFSGPAPGGTARAPGP